MDRFKPRTSALTAGLAACGLAAAVALSGCGAGQVSQMATQDPAVNGTSVNVGPISLRNIHLRVPSEERCSVTISGTEIFATSASRAQKSVARSVITEKSAAPRR